MVVRTKECIIGINDDAILRVCKSSEKRDEP